MISITSIETRLVRVPTRRKHQWAGLTETIGQYLLVKITASDGTVGWGEAPALKDWGGEFGRYYGESTMIVDAVIKRYLAPSVLGLEIGHPSLLHKRMDAAIKGYPYAKAAIDFAYYDLTGKALGVPVHVLLGGLQREIVPVTHSIGLLPIDEAVAEVKKVAADGIRTIKIKVGVEPTRDVAIVRAIREAVGPDIALCIDANEGYKTPGQAIQTVRQIQDCHLLYVEQPVMGIERIARVARAIDAPVMADESAWNAHDVIQIIAQDAAQIVSIYTTKPGGLYRAMQVSAVCEAAGIVCNVNGSVELGVGNLANVHLAAAAPTATLSNVIPVSMPAEAINGRIGGIYYADDLLIEPMTFEDGGIRVPTAPGMGIAVDERKVDMYAVDL
ncbi:mandelate racemase/muconate lactonizing enzyme family protein [Ancylobacter oerskovii]|uniref:Mandelate racemase/muconate lactonizing enzyme family protein n=1 Tax=Ancylobacter oerskovii TaxID=459519 RepID=A0ABW4YUW5_9HYPH|nr:enolase C-terminal domain-like protein [Ancylobacter oerskovii]MBS7544616.1 mandelate racemase [Ancylobacter oerskovii]